jgi:hypothetical protein
VYRFLIFTFTCNKETANLQAKEDEIRCSNTDCFESMTEEKLNEVYPSLNNMIVEMSDELETARSESLQS